MILKVPHARAASAGVNRLSHTPRAVSELDSHWPSALRARE